MAMGPPGGGQRRLTVEVVYALNQASMQQAASAVQTSGIRPLSELGQQAQKTAAGINFLGQQINVGQIVAWGLAWSAAYKALTLVTDIISGLTVGAVQRLAEWQQRQIMLAAEFINLDPSIPFNKAFDAADRFLNVLLELQPAFIGTRAALQEIFVATVRYFGAVDLSTAKAKQDFLTFANGIALAQIGINRAGSSFREVAALIEGVIRPGAQFLTLLSKIDPHIKEHIDLWRRQGTVIENIAKLLPGYAEAAKNIGDTIQSQLQRIEANIDRIVRKQAPGGLISTVLKGVGAVTAEPAVAIPAIEALLIAGFTIAANRAARTIAVNVVKAIAAKLVPALLAFELGQAIADPLVAAFFERVLGQPGIEPIESRLSLKPLRNAALLFEEFANSAEERLKDVSQAFGLGEASVEDYRQALLAAAEVEKQKAFFATGADQEQALRKRLDILRDLAKVDGELRRFEQLRPIRDVQVLEQSTRFEIGITDSFQRRRGLLADLLSLQEQRIGLLRQEAAAAAARGLDPRAVEERRTAVREAEQASRQTAREIELTGRQMRQIAERNEAEILQVGQRAFVSRMRALESQRVEELRQVEGSREAILSVEKKFILQRLQILEDARKSLAMAETEAAATRIRNIGQQGDLQQRLFQSQTSMVGFGTPLAPESGAQVRARFEQLQAIQQASSAAAIRDAEAQFRAAQATRQFRESASLRAEATARLFGVILQQADAQASLNRQEREALRTAQERDLTQEIRLLERRLALLNLAGGTDVLGTERQLDRAKAVAALRQLSAAELRQELEFAQRGAIVAPPGLDQTIWDRLTDRAQLLLTVLKEVTEEETAQVPALGVQQTQLDGLRKTLQGTHREIQDEAGRAVTKAMSEYSGLFDFVHVQLNSQVDLWRAAGDLSGKAFADAARIHLQNAFPGPTGGAGSRGVLGGIGGATSDITPVRSAGTTNIINLGGVDISSQLRPETVDDLIAAVMGARGDVAVARAGRQGVAGPVV